MIEAIAGMPDGTIGFRVWGRVTAADYDDVLIRALREAVDEHGEVRLVFQAGPEFDAFNVEWLRHSMQVLGWMTPGEARLFAVDELDEAKAWVAG